MTERTYSRATNAIGEELNLAELERKAHHEASSDFTIHEIRDLIYCLRRAEEQLKWISDEYGL